jgi:8-oxo-dGTP pyrophosphatase MutT (NUDIX family)
LHTKSFYPAGTYRLLTGGVKAREPLLEAVQRELREETGRGGRVARFLAVQYHTFRLAEQAVPFTSYIFLVVGAPGLVAPDDADEEITAYREATLDELLAAAAQMEALPPDWVDWGRFRASGHRLVVELLRAGADA